jgi:hypothetical protein
MPDIKLLTDRDARIVDGKFQYNDGEKWVETQKAYKTYGIRINLMDSNPSTYSYIGDASGMIAGSDIWDDTDLFQSIRPCVISKSTLNPGKRYLDRNDFTKFADGTDATEYISNDAHCDVFIEIPKIGVRIVRDDMYLTIQLTREANVVGFSYKAHSHMVEGDCSNIYVGAFLGTISQGSLRSQYGKTPTTGTPLAGFRGVASTDYYRATGRYGLLNFYTVTLLQCLYLMRYGNKDSQTALGMGYVGDSDWTIGAKTTGATFDKGMYYGSTDPMEQMKFMGIEDFWGNLYQWVDGLVSTEDFHALTCYIPSKMNDAGVDYGDLGQIMTQYVGGYMKEPQGTNDLGFIPKVCGGSVTTYFADYADFGAGYVPVFGGSFDGGSDAGAFQLSVYFSPDDSYDVLGGRLMLVASTDIEEVDSFETE